MENNIEIVIKSEGKRVVMQFHGKDISQGKALDVMQKAYIALVVSLLKEDMGEEEQKECAADVGKLIELELLDAMEGRSCKVHTTEAIGKDAAFLWEMMKRQGEVQG